MCVLSRFSYFETDNPCWLSVLNIAVSTCPSPNKENSAHYLTFMSIMLLEMESLKSYMLMFARVQRDQA